MIKMSLLHRNQKSLMNKFSKKFKKTKYLHKEQIKFYKSVQKDLFIKKNNMSF